MLLRRCRKHMSRFRISSRSSLSQRSTVLPSADTHWFWSATTGREKHDYWAGINLSFEETEHDTATSQNQRRKRLEPGYCSCRVLRASIEVHKQSTCMGVFSPWVRSAAARLFSSCRSGRGTDSREKSTVTRFAARLAGSTPSSWSRRRGGTLTECLLVNLSLRCVVMEQGGGQRKLWREEVQVSESSNDVKVFFISFSFLLFITIYLLIFYF